MVATKRGRILGMRADAVATSMYDIGDGELGSYAELNRILVIWVLVYI